MFLASIIIIINKHKIYTTVLHLWEESTVTNVLQKHSLTSFLLNPMSITFRHMDTQGMAHSLLGRSSLCAPKHSVLFSGCCCSPAHAKVLRGTSTTKAFASGKCPPAGHLPRLSFGFLLPEILPGQRLPAASSQQLYRTGLRGQSSGGTVGWDTGHGESLAARVNTRGPCQTCKTLPRLLRREWTRQG